MSGTEPRPEVVVRKLIDHGPDSQEFIEAQRNSPPLTPPWDGIANAIRRAGGGANSRWATFLRVIDDQPERLRIRFRVEDALLPPRPPEPTPGEKRFISAGAALHPQIPGDWLVHEFVAKPNLILAVGEAGAKKSFAVLDLAVSLAMGKPWLERKTSQANVLWIDEESGQTRFLNRLAQVMRGHEAPADLPFELSSLSGFDLRDEDDLHSIGEQARKSYAGLIVIDPLVGVIPGADENSVFHLAPILRSLQALGNRASAAVLIIHHTNKAGIYRGSSHLRGAVDLMLKIHSQSHTPLIEFQTLKTRDVPHQHFAAQIHFEPLPGEPQRVWLTPADLAQARLALNADQPLSPAAQHILDYLQKHGPSPTKALTKSAQTCTPEQVRGVIYRLMRNGIIERTNEGSMGTPATYALVG